MLHVSWLLTGRGMGGGSQKMKAAWSGSSGQGLKTFIEIAKANLVFSPS